MEQTTLKPVERVQEDLKSSSVPSYDKEDYSSEDSLPHTHTTCTTPSFGKVVKEEEDEDLDFVSVPRMSSSKPCRNGPLCRLEKKGVCVFDHSSGKASRECRYGKECKRQACVFQH